MCRMCEGFTLDDMLALEHARLLEYGFVTIGVGEPAVGAPDDHDGGATAEAVVSAPGRAPWTYTVGLTDLGHPELVMAGPRIDACAAVLRDLGRLALEGERLQVGDHLGSGASRIEIGRVHPVQYELETFATWHAMRARGMLAPARLEALQVFAPPAWLCHHHQSGQPNLGAPQARVGGPAQPNRAARRRRQT